LRGGFDRVLNDGKDIVTPDRERVFAGARKIDAFVESIPECFWEGLPSQC
jgi:hypothetical protein